MIIKLHRDDNTSSLATIEPPNSLFGLVWRVEVGNGRAYRAAGYIVVKSHTANFANFTQEILW